MSRKGNDVTVGKCPLCCMYPARLDDLQHVPSPSFFFLPFFKLAYQKCHQKLNFCWSRQERCISSLRVDAWDPPRTRPHGLVTSLGVQLQLVSSSSSRPVPLLPRQKSSQDQKKTRRQYHRTTISTQYATREASGQKDPVGQIVRTPGEIYVLRTQTSKSIFPYRSPTRANPQVGRVSW